MLTHISLYPICSHIDIQFEEKKGEECKQPQLLDNHKEQSDKAIKPLHTENGSFSFIKCEVHSTLRTDFKCLASSTGSEGMELNFHASWKQSTFSRT